MQWLNSVSTSLGSLFQGIFSFWQEPEDAFFMQAIEDENYQIYLQWCCDVRRTERTLRTQLERKQLSPAMLQNALLAPLANFSSSLISPLYYYLRLKKLETTLKKKSYPNAFSQSVQGVAYHLYEKLQAEPDSTRDYFYQDLLNHLLELSTQQFSANKLFGWLTFYKDLVEPALYQSVKQALGAFLKAHPVSEITARQYKMLIAQLNEIFQALPEAQDSVNVFSAEKSSGVNYRFLALTGLALTGGYAAQQVGNSYHVEQGLTQAGWQSLGTMGMGLIVWPVFSHTSFNYAQGHSWSLPVLGGLSTLFPLTAGQIINGVFELSSLNGTNGFVMNGVNASDWSGYSIASGDINGDGMADVLIGAPNASPGGRSQAGTSYVVFGRSGPSLATIELSTLTGYNGFAINGVNQNDFSGWSIASGDINADGVSDVLIGARNASPGSRSQAGTSYVVFGHIGPFPDVLQLSALTGANGFVINGANGGDHSGYSIASGDINGDGMADVLIGAPNASPGGRSLAGTSYVVFGRSGPSLATIELSTLDGNAGFAIHGVNASDWFGNSIASGDINGDGTTDILIGAYQASPGGITNAGAGYVVFGYVGSFPAILQLSTLDGTNGFVINGVNVGNASGWSIASGDINGDGIVDGLIGAPDASPGGRTYAGTSYVVFGHIGTFPAELELSILNGTNGFIINGNAGDFLGTTIASGDINADGAADMLIGAPLTGVSYVVFGYVGSFPAVFELSALDGSNGFVINGVPTYGYSSLSIASGDFNADGNADVLLGAYYASPGSLTNAGTSYVVFGSDDNIPISSSTPSPTPSSDSNSGRTSTSTSAKTEIAVGVSLAVLGLFAVGSGAIAYKLYKRREAQLLDLEMRGAHLSSKERRAIGRFVLVNDLDNQEAQTLYAQTGIRVEIAEGEQRQKVVLGEGEFGKVKLAYDREAHEFVGVKKIKGVKAMEASEQERLIHERLNGLPHILPLLYSEITEDSQQKPAFYQFIRLAGFGNGERLCQQLVQVTDEVLEYKLIQHVAQGLLTGIASMHAKNTYHLDIKPQNYMLTISGMVYVIDFGCTREFKSGEACWITDGATGDVSCFSPERLANFRYCLQKKEQNTHPAAEMMERFDAEKADAWSVGLALLELILGRYPLSDDHRGFNARLNHWDSTYMSQLLESAFTMADKGLNQRGQSLLEIIKGLLTIDPAQRLTVTQALKHPLFEEILFKTEELTHQLRAINESGPTDRTINNNETTRRDISLYSAAVAYHKEDPNYGSVSLMALKG